MLIGYTFNQFTFRSAFLSSNFNLAIIIIHSIAKLSSFKQFLDIPLWKTNLYKIGKEFRLFFYNYRRNYYLFVDLIAFTASCQIATKKFQEIANIYQFIEPMSKRSLKNYKKKTEFFLANMVQQAGFSKATNCLQQRPYSYYQEKPKKNVGCRESLGSHPKQYLLTIKRSDSNLVNEKQRNLSQNVNNTGKISISGCKKNYKAYKNTNLNIQTDLHCHPQKRLNGSFKCIRQNLLMSSDVQKMRINKNKSTQIQGRILQAAYIQRSDQMVINKLKQPPKIIQTDYRPKIYSANIDNTHDYKQIQAKTTYNQRNINNKKHFSDFTINNCQNKAIHGNKFEQFFRENGISRIINMPIKKIKPLASNQQPLRNINSNEAAKLEKVQHTFNMNQHYSQLLPKDTKVNYDQSAEFQRSRNKDSDLFLKPMWNRIKTIKQYIVQQRQAEGVITSKPLQSIVTKQTETQLSDCKNSLSTNLKTQKGFNKLSSIANQQHFSHVNMSVFTSQANSCQDHHFQHQLKNFYTLNPRNTTSIHDDDQSLQSSLVIAAGGNNIFGNNCLSSNMVRHPANKQNKIPQAQVDFTQTYPIRQTQRQIESSSSLNSQANIFE